MRFVKNFTPPDFNAKDFTPLISVNFNSFSDKNTKKSENGEIYTAGKILNCRRQRLEGQISPLVFADTQIVPQSGACCAPIHYAILKENQEIFKVLLISVIFILLIPLHLKDTNDHTI